MIKIDKTIDCCGCSACVQVCPRRAIAMQVDAEGFAYPSVDNSTCNFCGLCERVCPVLNQGEERIPLSVYAAKNKSDEIRLNSSSGGFFSHLAERVIEGNGVVFGARFNKEWEVIHDFAESIDSLSAFRGSKYLQSQIGETFSLVEKFLKGSRQVLFTGTPCQVAALKLFLGEEHKNLITADFVCHGVPSPKIWHAYLKEVLGHAGVDNSEVDKFFWEKITSISFRNKSAGWKNFSLLIRCNNPAVNANFIAVKEVFSFNCFMKGFLQNLYLRPSCYFCPARSFKSGSDITFADYWGVQDIVPFFDDDKGVSLVMVNSTKGEDLLAELSLDTVKTTLNEAMRSNPSIKESPEIPDCRGEFFSRFGKEPFIKLVRDLTQVSFISRLKKRIRRYVLIAAKRLGIK